MGGLFKMGNNDVAYYPISDGNNLRTVIMVAKIRKTSKQSTIDLSKTKRNSDRTVLDFILYVLFIFFIIGGVIVSLSNQQDLKLFFLLIISPTVVIIYFIRVCIRRIRESQHIRRLSTELTSIISLVDGNFSMFDVRLSQLIKWLLDNSDKSELITFGSLLSYGRILGIREGVVPVLEGDITTRRDLPNYIREIVVSLNSYDWTSTFRSTGDILALFASISGKGTSTSEEECKYTKADFSRFLRSRATDIYNHRVWSGSANVVELLRKFRDSFSAELSPWVALILFWLNARLYSFGEKSLPERGYIFATEYELLAHRLLLLAKAFEEENWDHVVNILVTSHRSSKYVPRFGLQYPS
jgi:hypothetical protein